MVPYYQERHRRQAVGLEGPDLAGQRRRDLLARARGVPRDSIQQFDSTQFHVASISFPGSYYSIDLNRSTCNCRDFPRSRFCKHLAAVNVHFPHLCKKESSPPIDFGLLGESGMPYRVPTPEIHRTPSPQEGVQKLMQDIKLLSKQLNDKIEGLTDESAAAVIQAVRSVKHSLAAAIASTQGSRALLDKEYVPPNQHSWTETAERMMWKRAPKRRLPDERGLTEHSIGAPKGRRQRVYTDPYAGGERSGKRAKLDALSAGANARARAPPMPPPPSALPSPNAFPGSAPFAPALAVTANMPRAPAHFPGFFPDPSAARALPHSPVDLPGIGNAPAGTCPPPFFGARDFSLGAAPFALPTFPGAPAPPKST